jgi:hypothetical protein
MRNLIAAALLLAAATARADHKVTNSFEGSAPAAGVELVSIEIPAGEVHIVNGKAGAIAIHGFASRNSDGPRSRSEQQRIIDDVSVHINVEDGVATVERTFGPNAHGWSAKKFSEFEITVEVPPGMAVDVGTMFGDVEVRGRFGDLAIDLRAGDVDVELPRDSVRELEASVRVGDVNLDSGERRSTSEGILPSTQRFENPKGTARVSLHATAGDVKVRLR